MNHNWGFTKSTFFIKCRVRDFFVCLEFLLCFFDKHIRFTKKKKQGTEKKSEKNIRKSFQNFFEKVKKAKNIFSRVKTRTN